MTDEAKALVERLRDFVIAEDIDAAADLIETLETQLESANEALRERLDICETQAREIERLREALSWAENDDPVLVDAIRSRAALAGDSHDQ